MKLTRRQWLTLAGSTLLATRLGANSASGIKKLSGAAFGTTWNLVLPAGDSTPTAVDCIRRAVMQVNSAMSPYNAFSEISGINRLSDLQEHKLSAHTSQVVSAALTVAELTNGAFDPTVGPLLNRFGFGPITGEVGLNFRLLEFDSGILRKLHTGITLDLCGIAKGYALDLTADYLIQSGIEHFLCEMGGEVYARGVHPSGRNWNAGIEQPDVSGVKVQDVVALNHRAVATSGTSVNSYRVNQRLYSHLIDTHTDQPVTGDLASVSVLSETAMLADAWSTAMMVLGSVDGPDTAKELNISALFLVASKDGFSEIRTGDFLSDS